MMRPTRYMRPYMLQPANFSNPMGSIKLLEDVVLSVEVLGLVCTEFVDCVADNDVAVAFVDSSIGCCLLTM